MQKGIKYKIIFTDFNMPIMDGIEATKHMRAYFNEELELNQEIQPAIVGITGHVQDIFTRPGYDAGMNQIIHKPVYKDQLGEVLIKYQVINN